MQWKQCLDIEWNVTLRTSDEKVIHNIKLLNKLE